MAENLKFRWDGEAHGWVVEDDLAMAEGRPAHVCTVPGTIFGMKSEAKVRALMQSLAPYFSVAEDRGKITGQAVMAAHLRSVLDVPSRKEVDQLARRVEAIAGLCGIKEDTP